ncbi:MAG TPA: ABC transporter permease [Bryobacteraceae bacterium]|nr:ABC transporter permease [Bryobacteraceae bacterium]
MTYLSELLSQVIGSLYRNKLRSFLTMAGIAWGLASMVIIVAMGDSFKEGQHNNTKELGQRLVILFGGRTEMQAGGQRAGRRIRLNVEDAASLRGDAWMVQNVSVELEGGLKAVSPYNSGSFDVSGVEGHFPLVRALPIAQGRFFTDREEKAGERVCVIGQDVKKQLFGTRPAVVGTVIALNSIPYRVLGLLASKDQNSSYSGIDEKKVFLPYTSMARDMPPAKDYREGDLSEILYQPRDGIDAVEAEHQVRKILGHNHDFDPADDSAMGMWDTVDDQKQVDGIFDSMTVFLGFIAFVTLSLGGIGVMNIMLVTVSERTREIGLRKALGATRGRILADFMAEGVVLAFVSGVIGWSVAFGLSSALKLVKMPDMFPGLPVSWESTMLAFVTLTVIAVLSALLPAWRAAALTPVEALRYER